MELMKKVADRHGLACLLHEKPFAGVNGSGKHNNWSLSTDTGINLFDPGKNPQNNKMFLIYLCAVIEAVDDHQDLLRISVASAGNDHRLGANEAPPAIVSMFLGSELEGVLSAIESGGLYNAKSQEMKTGVGVLPDFQKDTTDRNRTSPFAFTGNKFEFRMLGSSFSISGPNIILNTIVADVLEKYADRLEKAPNFTAEVDAIMKDTIRDHKRIVFNGNNYSKEWVVEAEKRGLLNLRSTPEALPYFISPKNIELFNRHHIFTEGEVRSRYEILIENYSKVLNIEALTMIDMAKKQIMPAVIKYSTEVNENLETKAALGLSDPSDSVSELARKLSSLVNILGKKIAALDSALIGAHDLPDALAEANYFHDNRAHLGAGASRGGGRA